MLTPRENVLRMISGEKPEYVPLTMEAIYFCGLDTWPLFEQPWVTGKDPYGVNWIIDSLGAMHDPSIITFDDIADWKKYVKIPDISSVDITEMANEEMSKVDRNQQLIEYYQPCGIFERLASFMGFENALIALVEDPESCMEFFDAVTDYKIKVANKVIDAYKPDLYVNFDDVANAKSTFMSPQTYREVIKPYHKKFAQAINERGVIFVEHTCGRCEDILEDYVDIGVKIWTSAQPMNDIKGILKRFKGRLIVEGGWDSSGIPGFIDATEEDIRAEVRRNIEEYGKEGGFILCPLMMNKNGNAVFVGDDRMPALMDEWTKVRYQM